MRSLRSIERRIRVLRPIVAALTAGLLIQGLRAQQQTQQPSDATVTITSDAGGSAPRFAVPDFLALSNDAETVDAAQTISQVLRNDLDFEHEFVLMAKDIMATVPPAVSLVDVPLDRWREVDTDGVIVGSVQKTPTGIRVEVKLFNVQSRQSVFSREYTGAVASRRLFAHQIADELHQQQRGLRGVARTKLTFNSDRNGEGMANSVETRTAREIYIADYDGEGVRQVTVQKSLNITSVWSPDARSIAYTSYRRGQPQIFISNIYQGTLEELTKAPGENVLPSFSPDGTRVAFASSRNGNHEIYVANRDGSSLRRLTNHPGADTTPTWAPSGTQIAFVSDRTGTPQIYVMDVDGLGLRQITHEPYADRPTWSPAPYNEIAFTVGPGPRLDIKVLELSTGHVKQLTFGEGANESPTFSPNGRHIAFTSTRAGRDQIFTMARDGRDLRQLTRTGSNKQADWSKQ